ncbi:DUF551 domain-containing protein [Paucibacter sp. O1-1]|nr:DUF551 domain-containing protein [Paucibacter sp. O1-1]MDA3827798.1 DUF551 domain-containing protein [Paucibacter sp. O1-1]
MTLAPHQDGLPALPEQGYLGDDASYGHDDCAMLEYGRACFEAGKLAAQPLPVQGEVPALALHPGPPRNHAYACQKDTTGGPTCKQWCGHQDLCLSTMTYPESYMQLAYEHGKRDALSALASEPQACRSVSGKCERQGGLSSIHEPQAEPVEQPGAVGLSEREAFDAFVRLERPSLLSGARTYNDENQVLLHLMDAAWSAWQARAALATQPVAPGWIPVTESLPAEDEPVLIAAWAWGYADGTRIYGVATRRGETWFNPQDAEALGEWWPATHWMPIPPPPAATQGAKTS